MSQSQGVILTDSTPRLRRFVAMARIFTGKRTDSISTSRKTRRQRLSLRLIDQGATRSRDSRSASFG